MNKSKRTPNKEHSVMYETACRTVEGLCVVLLTVLWQNFT